ncbi:hypothetical protein P7K49_031354 [Saguinus oedipus]|uniref:Uncharacterized protein n=1 Tax=Saguinus oedipus TaxID=9490 RepID=A0ABQ9U0B6_SAGOE|nr:hypothetical protein P7K49_031354 [Saguinus oedipus]
MLLGLRERQGGASWHFSIHCCPPFTFLNSKKEIVDRKYSICEPPALPAPHPALPAVGSGRSRATGSWVGEQGLPASLQLQSASLKQPRSALAPASSFFWPSQNQPPRHVPSEAQETASYAPRGGQSASQATVPSEVRASATPPPRGGMVTLTAIRVCERRG